MININKTLTCEKQHGTQTNPGPRATPEIESAPKVEKSIPVEIKKQITLEDRIKIRDKGYVKQIPNDNDPTHKFNAKNPFSEKK